MFLPHNLYNWVWFPFYLQWHHTSRNMRAARDMQNYRRGYPVSDSSSGMLITSGRDHPVLILFIPYRIWPKMSAPKTKWPTCSFISINIVLHLMVKHPDTLTEHSRRSVPSVCTDLLSLRFAIDVYIESFLKEWKNDYKRLERVHSYIQWYVCLHLCCMWRAAGGKSIARWASHPEANVCSNMCFSGEGGFEIVTRYKQLPLGLKKEQ